MKAAGLGLLDGADIQSAFLEAGVASNVLHARIHMRTFAKVNTVRGSWSFLQSLTRVPAVSQTWQKNTAPRLLPNLQDEAAPKRVPTGLSTVGRALKDLQQIIRTVAADVLAVESFGADFTAGEWEPLTISIMPRHLCFKRPCIKQIKKPACPASHMQALSTAYLLLSSLTSLGKSWVSNFQAPLCSTILQWKAWHHTYFPLFTNLCTIKVLRFVRKTIQHVYNHV